MLLDELVGVIDTLKQRIRTHGATLRANEIRTRVALIDPLLVALSWDVSDPALVTPEYNVGNGRADYALLGRAWAEHHLYGIMVVSGAQASERMLIAELPRHGNRRDNEVEHESILSIISARHNGWTVGNDVGGFRRDLRVSKSYVGKGDRPRSFDLTHVG